MCRKRQVPPIGKKFIIGPVCQQCSWSVLGNGKPPHHTKRNEEYRKRKNAVRNNLVDSVRNRELVLALLALGEGFVHQILDELVALVCDYRLRIIVKLPFAVAYVLLNVLHLANADLKIVYYLTITLKYLDGVPAN